MNLRIITGGSRGLGLALAKHFVSQGDHVAEISRSGAYSENNLKSYNYDLSEYKNKNKILNDIYTDFPMENYKSISLINNAGMVEPVKKIMDLNEEEVSKNINLNLVAPMILSVAFLRSASTFRKDKLIVNISSGVAHHPKLEWMPYSIAKAGLETLSEILSQQNLNDQYVKVINFEPGIVDTEMQAIIRSTSSADFSEVNRFKEFKEKGQLLDPKVVAKALARLMGQKNLTHRNFVSVYDLI